MTFREVLESVAIGIVISAPLWMQIVFEVMEK